MSCHEFKQWMSAYLDDELGADARRRFEEHLRACPACTRELADLRRLTEDLNMMRFSEPEDAELDQYWAGVYNRLERGVGWTLVSLGAIVLLCYAAWKFIEEMVTDPTVSLALKIGVCALVFGLVVLFVSLVRERLAVGRSDRYSKEIKR